MITPSENPDNAEGEKLSNTTMQGGQCVPLTALAVDGVNPAVGDAVEYQVAGKISRIEGDKAYVTAEKFNGEAAAAEAEEAEPDMMDLARQADAESEKQGR